MTQLPASWAGKILLVYVSSPGPLAQAGIAIADPVLETQHGRLFLTGKVPAHERDWASELPVAVAWDQVAHVLIFSTVDEYRSRVANAPSFWEVGGGTGETH